MKKGIIQLALAVFILASLAPNMQGTQLLKIPNLIHHVKVHFGTDWTWSEMGDFVYEHYSKKNLPKDSEHERLPFKSVQASATPMVLLPAEPIRFPEEKTFAQSPNQGILQKDEDPIHRSGLIWTPPQLV